MTISLHAEALTTRRSLFSNEKLQCRASSHVCDLEGLHWKQKSSQSSILAGLVVKDSLFKMYIQVHF